MQIIPGSSNYNLAKEITDKSESYKLLKPTIKTFTDGELQIQIEGDISRNVAIIQSTCKPANDHILELILLADTLKRAGAQEITAIIPYFGYSRQDRCTHKHGPISASAIIRMIEASGITKVITVDLHSAQLEGIFSVPVINLEPLTIFAKQLTLNKIIDQDSVIISPDIGGINRARAISMHFGIDLAIINKSRDSNNNVNMQEVFGDIANKNCILVDDIVDSANTLCKAAELLKEKGAKNVQSLISHAVLSGDAIDKINQSPLTKIYVTDSIPHNNLPSKFIQIPIAEILSSYLV